MKLKIILATALFWIPQYIHAQETASYTLEQCKSMALEHNKKMKIARYEIDAAKAAQKSVAASAYPSVDGSVMAVHLGAPLGGALNGMLPKFMANGSLTAAIPVYAGGKINNGKAAAAKGVEITEEQKNMTAAEVLLQTEKAYWQVVQVNEKIILAGKFKAMLESLQHDLQNAFDAGLIYKNDLLRVQVNLNEASLNMDKAKDGLVLAKLNLAQIIGRAGEPGFNLSDSVAGDFRVFPEQSLAAAENRPEIKMLKKGLEAQELQKKILQGDRLPTIALSASGLGAGGKAVNIKDGSDFMTTYYGIASISIPIFDWGKKANKVKEQSYKIAARQLQLEETTELINLEVQSAYLQLNQSLKKISLSQLSLNQATENLRIAEDRLQAGTIVGKDVLEAQAIWQQAYNNLIDARIEYKTNEASYKKTIGELN